MFSDDYLRTNTFVSSSTRPLKQGVNPNVQDKKGRTPLHWAVYGAQSQTSKKMIQFNQNSGGLDFQTIRNFHSQIKLEKATSFKNIMTFLIDRGGDINITDKVGCTPLCSAVKFAHIPLIKILIEDYGANGEVKDQDGFTPLFHAVQKREDAVTEILIKENKANVNAVDKNGFTPLHWAVYGASYEGDFDDRFRTPYKNFLDIIDLLVTSGANKEAKDPNNDTVLYYMDALSFDPSLKEEIIKLLRK